MSALIPAVATIFAPAAATGAAAAAGGFLTGVLGTVVKAGFVGGLISKATGGSFGKGFLLGGLGGAALGGLGTFGAGAAGAGGAAAGGAAAGGGLFSGGFLGQVLSGAASAWSEGAAMKEREEQSIREEERREGRYDGVGAALSPFDANEPIGLGGGFAQTAAQGGAPKIDERAVDRGVLSAGDEYQRRMEIAGDTQRKRRARYNPDSGRIEYDEEDRA